MALDWEDWAEKHRPKTSDEVQGQNKAVSKLKKKIQGYKKENKPLLLHGPPGTGKTCTVHAIASELGLEIVEVNASDVRNKGGINEVLGGATGQQSLFSKGKVILVDEIDGLSGRKDRGGAQAVMKLAKKSTYPIVMTANDPYQDKLSSLRKKSEMIEFGNLSYTSIAARLKKIADAEGIKYDENAIKALARRAGGDMRAAVNDFQTMTSDKDSFSKDDLEVLGARQRKDSIFDALVRVFKTTDSSVARGAYDEVDADLNEIFLWVENNIDVEYKKPLDLARGFDALSVADIFYGRIMRWQHFRFYVYCYDLLSAGIALAKDEKYKGFTRWKRSQKPLKIWRANSKLAKKKSIAEKAAVVTHTSISEAMQSTIPYFKLPAKKNKQFGEMIARAWELDESEADWLKS